MALTQQFARVDPEYLRRCRASALASPGAAPGWDPPEDDLLDTEWAVWGLIRYCRSPGTDTDVAALLDRATSGDAGGDIARALERVNLDVLLADHSDSRSGGGSLRCRPRIQGRRLPRRSHFSLGAARRGQCVVVWID